MLTIGDVMTRGPVILDRQQMMGEAVTRMELLGIRHLPVIEGTRLAGMISEADILRFQARHPERDLDATPLAHAITGAILTVEPAQPAAVVADLMFRQRLEVATVVEDGRIAGIFTSFDALRVLARLANGEADSAARAWPRRLLCAVDLSPPSRGAFEAALRLAGAAGEVTLFHAHDMSIDGVLGGSAVLEEKVLTAQAALRGWIDEHQGPGQPAMAIAVGIGEPAETIVREARQGGFDLVVVGSHGRTGARRLLVGSVAEIVARRAPCPVLVVRHQQDDDDLGGPVATQVRPLG